MGVGGVHSRTLLQSAWHPHSQGPMILQVPSGEPEKDRAWKHRHVSVIPQHVLIKFPILQVKKKKKKPMFFVHNPKV